MASKVLFVASTAGHLSHFHRPYLAWFRSRGWVVHAACGSLGAPLPEARQVTELPFRKKLTALSNLKVTAMVRRMVKRECYDLVVVHTSLAAFFTRLALLGMRNRPKLINMVHGYLFDLDTPPLKRALLLGAERLTRSVTDLLLTMNRDDQSLAEVKKLGRAQGFVHGIGLNPERLRPASAEEIRALRQKLELPPDAYVLLYAAEFSPRKDHATLLRAMTCLPEETVLLLPGDGELLEDCRRLGAELGIAHRVRFPGRISEMGAWYGLADGVVSSTRSEGLPFHILEPMYLEIPVTASDVRGNRDLIRHEITGYLFPAGDWQACGARLRQMMTEDTAAMTAAAREIAEAYTLDRVLPEVTAQYLSVL